MGLLGHPRNMHDMAQFQSSIIFAVVASSAKVIFCGLVIRFSERGPRRSRRWIPESRRGQRTA